jgi:competence protein ComEA
VLPDTPGDPRTAAAPGPARDGRGLDPDPDTDTGHTSLFEPDTGHTSLFEPDTGHTSLFDPDDRTGKTMPITAPPATTPPDASGPERGPSRVQLLRERVADRIPVSLRGALAPVPASAVFLVAVLVVVILAGAFLRNAMASPPTGTGGEAVTVEVAEVPPTSAAQATTAGDSVLVVDVVGRVRHPGVVRLPPGARVVDAIRVAGGATENAAVQRINLARPVVDGEQILVPGPNDPLPSGPQPTSGESESELVDLNTATASELEELPGIGPVLAERIVDWRTEHGRFSTVDELREVSGIGEKLISQLRPLVRV